MKRFYKIVSTKYQQGVYQILLDGKPIKTKGGIVISTPHEKIADGVVLEWAGQGQDIQPDSMPLTQILNTKIDRVAQERDVMISGILKFLDTDLICYLADEPPDLLQAQEESWSCWRTWYSGLCGATLKTTQGLGALKQDVQAHNYLEQKVQKLSQDEFTILQIVVPACGSVILALAFVAQEAGVDDIMTACFIEENFKEKIYDAQRYGPDPMLEVKKKTMRRDLEAAALYLQAL